MPSTYTLNNGIELIATGEQSGTWGNTTNTNLELLDTALDGQVTVTLASAGSSGSPNTLPISDGAASNGRNRMVIFNDGSDLGATAYVQLTPNDAEKIIYVRNSLSGSRSILLFQGTYNASNDYEVPAGTTAIVYFDGAGTGAVAANVFNNAYFDSLRLGSVSVTAILDEDNMASDSATALATQQSIKAYVDTQVGANNELSEVLANGNTTGGTDISVSSGDDITFADSSKAIFGAGSDLQIYHDGSNSFIQELGTGNLIIRADDFRVQSTAGESYIEADANGAVALRYDNASKLATTSTGVDITGTLTSDGLTVTGTLANWSIDSQGVIQTFTRPSTSYIRASDAAGNIGIQTGGSVNRALFASNGDLSLYEDTGTTPKFFWDASAESLGIGTSSPTSTLDVRGTIRIDGGGNSYIYSDASGTNFETSGARFTRFYTNSSERMRIDSSGNVGIGTTSPVSNGGYGGLTLNGTTGSIFSLNANAVAVGRVGAVSGKVFLQSMGASDIIAFQRGAGGTESMRIDASGNVGIGESSPDTILHIKENQSGGTSTLKLENSAGGDGSSFSLDWQLASTGTSAQIKGLRTNSPGAGDTDLVFSTSTNGTSLTEAMRIDSSGNVGIGTSSPNKSSSSTALTVNTGTAANYSALELSSGDTLNWHINANNSNVYDVTAGSRNRIFYTNGSERMRIDSSGNVGIGTSSLSNGVRTVIQGAQTGGAPATSGTTQTYGLLRLQGTTFTSALDMGTNGGNYAWIQSTDQANLGTNYNLALNPNGGNVGIGTSSPSTSYGTALHIHNPAATGSNLRLTNSTSGSGTGNGFEIVQIGADDYLINREAGAMVVYTSNTERMRIDSSGNLFIGKTAESATTAGWQFKQSGEAIVGRVANDTIFVFQNSTTGSTVGSISITGSSTAYNTSSDYRLKEDVQPMVGATDRVLALNPVNFAWKADGTRVDGFLAHEAQAVVPEAVTGTHNEVDDDGNAVMQGIDQSKLVPLLTAALKEAITKIETLETEMTSVKARLDALEGA